MFPKLCPWLPNITNSSMVPVTQQVWRGRISVLHARILAVADCYDAIVSDRPYRKGLPKRQALEILIQKSGTQFDPMVIEVFTRLRAAGQLV
jgi:response regulator RpfG family c-di-GMP phosphodiesterase